MLLLLFNKFDGSQVTVDDISLSPFINVNSNIILPHTASRLQKKFNGKSKLPIVERFACYLMKKGRNSGKKILATRCIKDAFFIIHYQTGQNPLQILVDALINSGPREDSARVGKGGAIKRTSVDVSPIRRLNISLFLLTKGIRLMAMKNVKTLPECIAEELVNAAKANHNSYAVKKRDEIERIAKSNR